MPPREAVLDAIKVYFTYCHMQPLWLFDRNDLSSTEDDNEEIFFSLLALSLCHSTHIFFQGRQEELARKYAQLAREQIMLRIAVGKVTLSTIQSLCMLALANFQANDMQLASLHISIASTFSKCAGLDLESHHDEVLLPAETRRRVFWSLHLLNQLYGQHISLLDIHDIGRPHYVAMRPNLQRKLNGLPPCMPEEMIQFASQETGIWAYMVQMSSLWSEVRMYVMQCADMNNEPPWSVKSEYAAISAHLMDLETQFPTCNRYDSARFLDREKERLQQNREYWSSWAYLQFTYHTIHCMLNHPFLYSSRPQQSDRFAMPNTFWKTSSDLAFIHATWIVRLVGMVSEKSYRISDPFIGHCIAVAATTLIYFCRVADKRIRDAAKVKLQTCVTFLGELALLWPSCKLMHEQLQTLLHSALAPIHLLQRQENSRTAILINTRLMWKILRNNFDARSSRFPSQGLFQDSFCRDNDDTDENADTVETEVFHNPTAEVDMSSGGQALPPYSGQPSNSSPSVEKRLRQNEQPAAPIARTLPMPYTPLVEMATMPWAVSGNNNTIDMAYDPLYQFQDLGNPFYGTWEFGNL